MNHISIPGPFKFSHTYNVPPINVNLPMVVSAQVVTLVLKAILSAVVGAIFLGSGALFLWATKFDERFQLAGPIIVFVAVAIAGSVCIGSMVKCIHLAWNPKDQLDITAEGVRDRRQDVHVAWTNVRHMSVKSNKHGWSIVQLHLHQPVEIRSRLFEFYFHLINRESGRRVDIDIMSLNERRYILVHTMGALVRHCGGTTDELTQWEA
ncbi:hypothetical protein [Methylobacterium sp. V23]|jgi:hypothetical protein|uniref:hypothetical protein n=1 Tax=Methylobacterium sp. V23 TaxID=2044878 RepID=UPI0011B0E6ED|nr:hypothetical protein [Methylobacterium sp. V23]